METDHQQAELNVSAMVAFARDVMALHAAQVPPEAAAYSQVSYDFICDAFLAGALSLFCEATEFPTPPRERAFLGLITYLTQVKGLTLDKARERAAVIYSSLSPNSKAQLAYDLGWRWQDPNALRQYFVTQKPKGIESRDWLRTRQLQLWIGIAVVGALMLLGAGLLIVR